MVRECSLTQTGTTFKTGALKEVGLDPSKLYPRAFPRPEALLLEQANPDRVGCKHGTISAIECDPHRRRRPGRRALAYQRPVIVVAYLVASRTTPDATKVRQERQNVGNADEVRSSFRTRVPLLIRYLRINLAKGRFLPLDNNHPIRVREAVKLRMDHPEMFVDGPYMDLGTRRNQSGWIERPANL